MTSSEVNRLRQEVLSAVAEMPEADAEAVADRLTELAGRTVVARTVRRELVRQLAPQFVGLGSVLEAARRNSGG